MKSAVLLVLLITVQSQPPVRILNPTNPNPGDWSAVDADVAALIKTAADRLPVP